MHLTEGCIFKAEIEIPYRRKPVEFFTVCTKLAEMAILYSNDLTTAKKSYLQWGST